MKIVQYEVKSHFRMSSNSKDCIVVIRFLVILSPYTIHYRNLYVIT
jgi:hypothetical protein